MSARAVWVLSVASNNKEGRAKVVFERHYRTVEARCQSSLGEAYIPCPDAQQLIQALDKLNFIHKDGTVNYSESVEPPVYEINTEQGGLWPLIVVKQKDFLLCGLTAVNSPSKSSILSVPEISQTFDLLMAIKEFILQLPSTADESHPLLMDLSLFLSEIAPFGSIADQLESQVLCLPPGKIQRPPASTKNIPSWRTVLPKSKSSVHLLITEHIHCIQVGNSTQHELHGKIIGLVDLDTVKPEVTVVCRHKGVLTNHLITHPIVHSTTVSRGASPGWSLTFIPPTDQTTLCHYEGTAPNPPLSASYSCQGDMKTQFTLTLKKLTDFKGSVESLEISIPFSHIGTIKSHRSDSNIGSLKLNPDCKSLLWNLGSKIPANSKLLESTLVCSVEFCTSSSPFDHTASHALMSYRIVDYSASCVSVELVHIKPNTKHKLSTAHQLTVVQHRVNNRS